MIGERRQRGDQHRDAQDVRDLKDELLDASRGDHATRSLTRRRSRSAPIDMTAERDGHRGADLRRLAWRSRACPSAASDCPPGAPLDSGPVIVLPAPASSTPSTMTLPSPESGPTRTASAARVAPASPVAAWAAAWACSRRTRCSRCRRRRCRCPSPCRRCRVPPRPEPVPPPSGVPRSPSRSCAGDGHLDGRGALADRRALRAEPPVPRTVTRGMQVAGELVAVGDRGAGTALAVVEVPGVGVRRSLRRDADARAERHGLADRRPSSGTRSRCTDSSEPPSTVISSGTPGTLSTLCPPAFTKRVVVPSSLTIGAGTRRVVDLGVRHGEDAAVAADDLDEPHGARVEAGEPQQAADRQAAQRDLLARVAGPVAQRVRPARVGGAGDLAAGDELRRAVDALLERDAGAGLRARRAAAQQRRDGQRDSASRRGARRRAAPRRRLSIARAPADCYLTRTRGPSVRPAGPPCGPATATRACPPARRP